jgi:AraC-like DNA-binding protein
LRSQDSEAIPSIHVKNMKKHQMVSEQGRYQLLGNIMSDKVSGKYETVSLLEGATFEFSSPNHAFFRQSWENHSVSNHLVTGNYWLYRTIRLRAGSASYFSNGRMELVCGPSFGTFFPPNAISYGAWNGVTCEVSGVWSNARLPRKLIESGPLLFQPGRLEAPTGVDHLVELLSKATNRISIDRTFEASAVSMRTKRQINQTFTDANIKMKDIALSLKLPASQIADYFRRDLGLTPVVYRNFLRMELAVFLLAQGKKVQEVCSAVGFSDPTRFYRAAQRYLNATPSRVRRKAKDIT